MANLRALFLKLTRSPKPEYEYDANGHIVIRPVLIERLAQPHWWSKALLIAGAQGHKSPTAPTIVQRYRTFAGYVKLYLYCRRQLHCLGYRDVRALLMSGTAEHIAAYTIAIADEFYADDLELRAWHVHEMLQRLLKARRGGVLPSMDGSEPRHRAFIVDVVRALLDQGFPPHLLVRSPRSSIEWLCCEPTVYQRLILDMTREDLDTGVVESYGTGQMAWFVFLEATTYCVNPAKRQDVMIDQVVLLRNKGVDVTVERLESLLYNMRSRIYAGARDVIPLLKEVDVELRRREAEALNAIADQTMAETEQEAPVYVRKRM
ncbi:hypothetical protein [Paraburkholderia sp. C35]|uniref:hypothetical protein n=1 Tax=Paraburkholderia sp. C35 TaxID=2126993 RepID=UPI000D699A93|nr:hypothetical protein [Paraburkholderia sp. C35]